MKRDYKDLVVWQKAMTLVVGVYRAAQTFPREELFGLAAQMRRAAVSVPSNIAEGQARPTRGEFRQFHGYAKGSLAELETQLLIARELGYLQSPDNLLAQLHEVARLLNGLAASLSTKWEPTTDN